MGDDQLPYGAVVGVGASTTGSASPATIRCRAASW